MSLVIIKLAAIPLLLWMVMIVSRHFGSLVGGVVSGLPLTSATISFFMAIKQGSEFAYRAAWAPFKASWLTSFSDFFLFTPAVAFIGRSPS